MNFLRNNYLHFLDYIKTARLIHDEQILTQAEKLIDAPNKIHSVRWHFDEDGRL